MTRFDHHANPGRVQDLLDRQRDLARHALLDLEAVRVHVDEARHFAQADHPTGRQIGDVHASKKRQQMVLAEAEEVDVLDHDEVVVLLFEKGVPDDFRRIDVVALGQIAVGLGHAQRRVDKAFARGVLTQFLQQARHQAAQPVGVELRLEDAQRETSTELFSDSTSFRRSSVPPSSAAWIWAQNASARFSAVGITPFKKATSLFRFR